MAEPDPESLAASTRLRRRLRPGAGRRRAHPGGAAAARRRPSSGPRRPTTVLHPRRAGAGHPAGGRRPPRRAVPGRRRTAGWSISAAASAPTRWPSSAPAWRSSPWSATRTPPPWPPPTWPDRAEVLCADAEEVAVELLTPGVGAFCDPARRNARGRSWRVDDFTPAGRSSPACSDGRRPAGVKLGPALPHDLVPADAEAEWLTDAGRHRRGRPVGGSGVGAGAPVGPGLAPPTSGTGSSPTRRSAELTVRDVGGYLYEPVGAVIRSRRHRHSGRPAGRPLLDPHLAYLTGDRLGPDPVRAPRTRCGTSCPYDARRCVAGWPERQIGRLEIKHPRHRRSIRRSSGRVLRPGRPEERDAGRVPDHRTGRWCSWPNGRLIRRLVRWHSLQASANVGLALSPGVCQLIGGGRTAPRRHSDHPDIRTHTP